MIGKIGAGKSSLLSALLGDMHKMNGTVYVNDSLAYVPQQAWIQNATLKDNILFGRACSPEFYDAIIEACALSADISIMPAADDTEIGEKVDYLPLLLFNV